MIRSVTVRTSPSLALIKYWGKQDRSGNIPATSSLAVTLSALYTESTVAFDNKDKVILDGAEQDPVRYGDFFDGVRKILGNGYRFRCESRNNFPTASGLASSSSGFAALALGINHLTGETLSSGEVSSLARTGSASAARAVYGGFTRFSSGAESASPLYDEHFWPGLRVIVVSVSSGRKIISSRQAMKNSRETSPFYNAWLEDSEEVFCRAVKALEKKELHELGPLIRKSYLRMFSTMFAADPPLIYWQPESLGIIQLCSRLREKGIDAWETMDAGPQVKIFCLNSEADRISEEIRGEFPLCSVLVDKAGSGPVILEKR